MFSKDALNVGPEHNFTYWEDQITFTPLQFQGPGIDFLRLRLFIIIYSSSFGFLSIWSKYVYLGRS